MLSLSNWPRFQTIYYCMLFCLSKNTKWRLVYWKGQHIAAAAEFFPRNAYHVVLRGCMHWPRNLLALSSSDERPQPLLPSKCSSSNKIVVQVILWIEDPSWVYRIWHFFFKAENFHSYCVFGEYWFRLSKWLKVFHVPLVNHHDLITYIYFGTILNF